MYRNTILGVSLLLTALIFANLSWAQDIKLEFCNHGVESLKWSPDGSILAVQGGNGTRLYDKDLILVDVLPEDHYVDISFWGANDPRPDEYSRCWGRGISWYPDGLNLISPFVNNEDGNNIWLKTWDVTTGLVIQTFPPPASQDDTSSIEINTQGTMVATVGRGDYHREDGGRIWSILLYDLRDHLDTPLPLFAWFGDSLEPINTIAWSYDTKFLASGDVLGNIKIWSIDTDLNNNEFEDNISESVYAFNSKQGSINELKWHPSRNLLASVGDSEKIIFWNVETKTIESFIETDTSSIKVIDWNSDGTLLASAGDDATIRIWDIATGEQVAILEGHEDSINALDWSPDDKWIATASLDNTVRVWDVLGGE